MPTNQERDLEKVASIVAMAAKRACTKRLVEPGSRYMCVNLVGSVSAWPDLNNAITCSPARKCRRSVDAHHPSRVAAI
jgi:hypothetical protein